MPIIFQNQIHPQDPVYNPSVWYVTEAWPGGMDTRLKYADNVIPFVCRQSEFLLWNDEYYEDHCTEFENQMSSIRRKLLVRSIVVFPSEFCYKLEHSAPKTFQYIFDRVLDVAEEYNQKLDGVKEMTSREGF